MSRIGNRILIIPAGIKVEINKDNVVLSNATENLVVAYTPKSIKVEQKETNIVVTRKNDIKENKMLHGTVNANLNNAIVGLTTGFKKTLILKGVGYKAKVEGTKIVLSLGFSHPVILDIPKEVKVETPVPAEIILSSVSKEVLGQFCAVIRKYRMPEPYKGKGVLFKGEQIIRKAGKTADRK